MAGAKHREHASVDERRALGRAARRAVPRSAHGDWEPAPERRDPVELLIEQNARRVADLVPVRHGRMRVSPFTFYRGAARVMAADLASEPRTGLTVQLCGDAHLSNFGLFASPERALVFDLNDFDETLPGPWEWDVKRMAASFTIAGRHRGFDGDRIDEATRTSVAAYREAMARFAGMGVLDVWYAQQQTDTVLGELDGGVRKRATRIVEKAQTRDSLHALSRFAVEEDGRFRIKSSPPLIVPIRELAAGVLPADIEAVIDQQYEAYRASLPPERRVLLDRFRVVDVARKVVGVGSVGTQGFMVLLEGRDRDDPLFLQLKEATASVLEEFLPKSRYRHPAQRVVHGQRSMQAASDIFLGWTRGVEDARHYYWRQLRDMKGSVDMDAIRPRGLTVYARLCGWTLARAHARTGDPVAIAAYLGKGPTFDEAIVAFSARYADQNEHDHAAFVRAIETGRIEAIDGV